MAKTKTKTKTKRKSAPDRHVFSALLGLVLGTCGFYLKRSVDSKSATT